MTSGKSNWTFYGQSAREGEFWICCMRQALADPILYKVSQEASRMPLQQSWHPSLVSLEHTCAISFSEAYTTYLNNKFNVLLCMRSDKLRQPLIGCGADCGQSQPWLVKARSTNWCETKAMPSVSHNTTWLWQNRLPPLAGHVWRLRTPQKDLRRVMQTQISALATSIYSPRNPPHSLNPPSTLPVHRPCGLGTNCVPLLLFWRAPWDPATCAPALPSFSISLGSKYIIYIIYIEGYYIKTSQKNLSPKPFLKTLPKA